MNIARTQFALFAALCIFTAVDAADPTAASTREANPQRHINLEGQPNFRDLGGYKTADGRSVKWGQVYRSGELPRLSDEDVRTLANLQLKSVVNFLTSKEIAKSGEDRIPEGVRQIGLPMEAGNMGAFAAVILDARKTGDFSKVPPEINPDLHRYLIAEGKEYYSKLLREVADSKNRPLVFHCSHGIHRTGTATAILLSALGVPWDVIRDDYLLSNKYRRHEIKRRIQELKELDAKNRGVSVDSVDTSNIEAFYVLKGSYIDAALEQARKEYGSMEAYIREGLGISDEEVQQLRDELLEGQ